MIDTLLSAVLPIFALVAIGFGLGRAGIFGQAMAGAVNRLVFLISIPALIFSISESPTSISASSSQTRTPTSDKSAASRLANRLSFQL